MPKNSSDTVRLDPLVWKITSVAVLGSFLAQLDATIVNVSLSSLAVDLHSSLTAIQWVTSGYLLALALMLPLNGWLVERIGAKSLYLWCFSVFTLSSALCGLAWSANSLIAFRILQGMSGGLMAPMTQMMMARAAGKHMAPHGLRGCANPDRADPWPGHRRRHSATRLLALALPGQRAGRCIGNRPGGSLSAR
jgi:MFS family permease